MYLFIFLDGSSKQVTDNLSVADLLGVRERTLRIFRYRGEAFEQLVADECSLTWMPVKEARVVACKEIRFHL